MNATQYQIEGMDSYGQWSWGNVSSDGVEAYTIFDNAKAAEEAVQELIRIFDCAEGTLRVIEIEPEGQEPV